MKQIAYILIVTLLFTGMIQNTAAEVQKPESLSAKSCVVMDAVTGTVLFGKEEDAKRSMASTTKIMTTLLVLENADLQQSIVTTKEMVTVEGSGMGLLAGDTITFEGLCYGMMLCSGNDAANTAAIALAGSLEAFADRMNAKACEIGMRNTHFVTPSGLDDDVHYSTAYDMALLAAYALKNETFRAIASSSSAVLHYGNPPYRRTVTNHNKLLSSYEGCIGVKTGFTKKSGRCLVSAAERDGAELICVTLSAPDDWNDHKSLLDYGFAQMEPITLEAGTVSVPVTGGNGQFVTARHDALTVTIPAGCKRDLSFSVQAPHFLYAPVAAGATVGQVSAVYKGAPVAGVPLTVTESVERVPYDPPFLSLVLEKFCRLLG